MKYAHVKRVLDCVGALVGLIVLSPVIIVVSLLVLIFLGRPILFFQDRVTVNGRIFRICKFRSMRPASGVTGSRGDHDRLTVLGRILRSTSLDELPSLWNVLIGDLSIVGPRPLRPIYLPLYTPEQYRRHLVRGGLTGLAQVNGRNAISWDDKFDYDVSYVDRMGPFLDFKIVLKTFGTVLGQRGVNKQNEATTDSYGGTLRSDLVEFKPRTGSAREWSWDVFALGAETIGTAEIVLDDRANALIQFDRDISCESDRVMAEVLRLLTNRARGLDASTAVCRLEEGSAEMKHYMDLGFSPLSLNEYEDVCTFTDESSSILLGCRLWPNTILEEPRTLPL